MNGRDLPCSILGFPKSFGAFQWSLDCNVVLMISGAFLIFRSLCNLLFSFNKHLLNSQKKKKKSFGFFFLILLFCYVLMIHFSVLLSLLSATLVVMVEFFDVYKERWRMRRGVGVFIYLFFSCFFWGFPLVEDYKEQ